VIGLEWELVHDEACRWEHVISEEVEEHLVELLNAPRESPYGNPIPGLSELGVQRDADGFRTGNEPLVDVLDQATGSVRVRLVRIGEELQKDVELMANLRKAGVTPGTEVEAGPEGDGIRLGIRLGQGEGIACELDRMAAVHLFVNKI